MKAMREVFGPRGWLRWGLLGSALVSVACESILDIQEAELDPLGGGGAVQTGLCADYCAAVQANCVGPNQVYGNEILCMGICEKLPQGQEGDQLGNTVGCRLTNAIAAKTTNEPNVHCPVSGPGGDNTCGSDCEAYCTLLQSVCGGRFDMDFADIPDCLMKCKDIPDVGPFSSNIQEGDSLQCRLYHLSAATDQPGVHCAHAAGDGPCAGGA